MGVSVGAATLVIVTGIMVSTTVLLVTLVASFQQVQEALDSRTELGTQQLGAAVQIANVTAGAANITINATNTGSVTIDAGSLQVLVNGTIRSASISSVTIAGQNSTVWTPLDVLRVVVGVTPVSGERVKLVTTAGTSAYGVVP